MAVQFILGGSGTGKTRYLYDKMIADSMKPGHRPVIFMLPEQSNMAAEQDMVSLHPKGGTMDIAILSFTRLAFKVFDEQNIHTRDILDDYGKSMLLMKLLKEHQKELSYYGNMIGKPGFVDEVKSLLSEFYQYGITQKTLEDVLAKLDSEKSLYYKLSDLKILLTAFEQAMQDSYMVAEQVLSLLREAAGESAMLREADIYFDGFTGFTPIQYDVLEELMKLGGNLYFSFTMDEDIFGKNDYSEQGLFALGKQSVDRLCKLAEKNRIAVLPHVGMVKNYRLEKTPELYHMERQLFRFPVKAYDKEIRRIEAVSAKDSREEALFIARTIKRYVMEEGYHYHDFAVITGDLREQSAIWKRAMEQLEVPYFLDFSEELSHNPIVETAKMIMELFRTDFSYDSVFSFLKTGFFAIGMEDIYNLENYALKYGVKGYSWWKKPFRGGIKGLREINGARKQFMEGIKDIAPVFLKPSARAKEYIIALYDFMSTNRMAERLHARSIRMEESGSLREAKAYGQVYDKFISVLDKTMDILGEEEIDREHLIEILLAGISDLQLGIIPSTLDQVVIGDMERTRLHHIRILFVAGANEGLLPPGGSGRGILVDKDRKQLKEMHISLAPDSKEEIFLQQFYLYLQITQASEKLVITYRNADEKGAELRPSYFVNRMVQIFPGISVKRADMENMLPATEKELVSLFAESLADERMEDSSLYYVTGERNPVIAGRIMEGYFYRNQAGVLDKAIARKLYGEHMLHSVSRLETYSGCAYQFFLKFGLKVAKREEYKIEANNVGTILHAVMERFFRGVKEGKILLEEMTEKQLDEQVETMTLQAAREENETIFESSYRNRHQLEVLVRVARRSIKNLCRHMEQGGMEPAYFEKRFSPEDKLTYITMALEDGIKMELNGIVDRVDVKETEDAVYLKVIDYKSGAKDIDYIKMYEGKQLQLTVYMSVMMELLKRQYPDKKIIPTGMYYYRIYDPVIEETEEDKIEQKRVESSRLSGLVNEEEKSLELMDEKTGTVTPVRYKKDGELDARNGALVTTEEMVRISEFVREKMIEIGEKIIHGRIEMNPEKGEHNCPCNFCDYKSICRFEAGLGGNEYRIGSNLEKKEAKDRILKKEGENA
ncbi:MAG: PD-(D/E)XK nuclease family protein [Bacteroidales bacterium]|nr:PD-(D/E)XK nuclease family protein [Clostridium sp.]MCM1204536.1 PD-(D/E)XK nuclease family protein [Bacteroidales bacterium]